MTDNRADRGFRVRGLGEVAIRCRDLPTMTAFYRDILGLERIEGGYPDSIVFYRVAEGIAGHTAVLALFESDGPSPTEVGTGERSSLHHIALSLPAEEQAAVMNWYKAQGLSYSVVDFPWIGWRGVFTKDPDGNTVEIVAYVGSSGQAPADQATGLC